MKKREIKNLSLNRNTISKFSELHQIIGGTDTVSGFIICMEEFTEGCSPSFLNQCPKTRYTAPTYCW